MSELTLTREPIIYIKKVKKRKTEVYYRLHIQTYTKSVVHLFAEILITQKLSNIFSLKSNKLELLYVYYYPTNL
jgi:hypothetical protein